jgi:AhpD family alkylhydroperoxidase
MKNMRIAVVVAGAMVVSVASLADSEDTTAYKDIQQTLGFVPAFFRAVPAHGIAGAWEEMKALELNPSTSLPVKTKELVGLAVAAQIPCRYCAYFHTSMAKAHGASEQEIKEAIGVAALNRHWSTVLNGMQIDLAKFKDESTKMLQTSSQKRPPDEKPIEITDAASAYKDMERVFGTVPTFMKQFPETAVAPAWREFKSLLLSTETALDGKTKDLIGLAVSAQVPCSYCVYFDTAAARQAGASDTEIREAVAMAAITRHWSTVLNGSMIDETAFRHDVDRLVKGVERAAKSAKR